MAVRMFCWLVYANGNPVTVMTLLLREFNRVLSIGVIEVGQYRNKVCFSSRLTLAFSGFTV